MERTSNINYESFDYKIIHFFFLTIVEIRIKIWYDTINWKNTVRKKGLSYENRV